MIPSEEELKTTKFFAKRKMREIAKQGEDMSDTDLLDLCTLNLIEDSCNEELKVLKEIDE